MGRPGHRHQVALRQPALHHPHPRTAPERKRHTPRVPVSPNRRAGAATARLVATRHPRHLGQREDAALCGAGQAPRSGDAPGDGEHGTVGARLAARGRARRPPPQRPRPAPTDGCLARGPSPRGPVPLQRTVPCKAPCRGRGLGGEGVSPSRAPEGRGFLLTNLSAPRCNGRCPVTHPRRGSRALGAGRREALPRGEGLGARASRPRAAPEGRGFLLTNLSASQLVPKTQEFREDPTPPRSPLGVPPPPAPAVAPRGGCSPSRSSPRGRRIRTRPRRCASRRIRRSTAPAQMVGSLTVKL